MKIINTIILTTMINLRPPRLYKEHLKNEMYSWVVFLSTVLTSTIKHG